MRLLSLLLVLGTSRLAIAQTSVTVVGLTPMQSLLSYTCSSSSAATIEVSESNTYSPLVHDVDGGLFTNANLDGSSVIGTRQFVVGKRGLTRFWNVSPFDSRVYSRALQAFTTHYYRISGCGAGSPATGQFTTANLLMNTSYQDLPPMDSATPGNYLQVSIDPTNRGETFIDPLSGNLITKVSIPGDTVNDGGGGTGPFLFYGGFSRMCGTSLVNGGTGWLCAYPQGNGGRAVAYFINATTHAAAYLGHGPSPSAALNINPVDGKFYDYDAQNIGTALQQMTYTGPYTTQTSGTSLPVATITLIANLPAAIQTFNAGFVPSGYVCSISAAIGDYISVGCNAGNQGSYGWAVAVQITHGSPDTAAVVAATALNTNIRSRWCGSHNLQNEYDTPSMLLGLHFMDGSGGFGSGIYESHYLSGGSFPAGTQTITVDGEPTCAGACGTDPNKPIAATGDIMQFQDNKENVTLLNKISPTSWQISATTLSHSASAGLIGQCLDPNTGQFPIIYWKFLADPLGTDATNTNYIANSIWPQGGHDDAMTYAADHTKDYRMTEGQSPDGWVGRLGAILANLTGGTNFSNTATNFFAGLQAPCYGDGCRRHPSAGNAGANWLSDMQIWDKPTFTPFDTLTHVSGQLYTYSANAFPFKPRYLPIISSLGNAGDPRSSWHSLLDVSPTVLGTTSGDQYKSCVVNAVGDCFAGSTVGQVYINVPGSPNSCQDGLITTVTPCLGRYNSTSSQLVQSGVGNSNVRAFGGAIFDLKDVSDFPTAKTLPDGSGLQFTIGQYQNNTPSQLFIAKLPPFTVPDSVDRTKFIDIPINLTNPGVGSATTADILFGYRENDKTPTVMNTVFLGDSITLGAGISGGGWVPRGVSGSNGKVTLDSNAGVAGNTVQQMFARMSTDVWAFSPNTVVVMGGTNNIAFTSDTTSTIIASLTSIIADINSHGATPVLCTILPIQDVTLVSRVEDLNWAIRQLAASTGSLLFDANKSVADPATGLWLNSGDHGDNLHPTSAGSAAIGTAFDNFLLTTFNYCTSRSENCVSILSGVPPTDGTTDPFKYYISDITNGSWSGAGVSCASTCTVHIPVYPGHIVYYQAEFRNSSNAVVATGTPGISGDFVSQSSVGLFPLPMPIKR